MTKLDPQTTGLTIAAARKMMLILEDCFPLDLDAQATLVRRLRSDFPEFSWDKIQQCPMIVMVGEKNA